MEITLHLLEGAISTYVIRDLLYGRVVFSPRLCMYSVVCLCQYGLKGMYRILPCMRAAACNAHLCSVHAAHGVIMLIISPMPCSHYTRV